MELKYPQMGQGKPLQSLERNDYKKPVIKKTIIEFDYDGAIRKLKILMLNYDKVDKKTAKEVHDIYWECPYGKWNKVFLSVRKSMSTWYRWIDKYGLELKYPEKSHADLVPQRYQNNYKKPVIKKTIIEVDYE